MWQWSSGCRAELLHLAVKAMASSLGMDMDGLFMSIQIPLLCNGHRMKSLALGSCTECRAVHVTSAATMHPISNAVKIKTTGSSPHFHQISRRFVLGGQPRLSPCARRSHSLARGSRLETVSLAAPAFPPR